MKRLKKIQEIGGLKDLIGPGRSEPPLSLSALDDEWDPEKHEVSIV
jgi:hypothetical protein